MIMKWMSVQHHIFNLCFRQYRNKIIRFYCSRFDSVDPFKVLGLPPDASLKEVREAYIRLSKEFHPDVNGSKNAIEKFKKVCAAYEALKTEEKRKEYVTQNVYSQNTYTSKGPNHRHNVHRHSYGARNSRVEKQFEEFMREHQRQQHKFYEENNHFNQQQYEYWRHKKRQRHPRQQNLNIGPDYMMLFTLICVLVMVNTLVLFSKYMVIRELHRGNRPIFYDVKKHNTAIEDEKKEMEVK